MTKQQQHGEEEQHICSALFKTTLHDRREWLFADYSGGGGDTGHGLHGARVLSSSSHSVSNKMTGAQFVQSVTELARAVRRARSTAATATPSPSSPIAVVPICVISAPPSVAWLQVALATLGAGNVLAPLNVRYTSNELRDALHVLNATASTDKGKHTHHKNKDNSRVIDGGRNKYNHDNNNVWMLVSDGNGLERYMATGEQLPRVVILLQHDNTTTSEYQDICLRVKEYARHLQKRQQRSSIQSHQHESEYEVEVFDSLKSFLHHNSQDPCWGKREQERHINPGAELMQFNNDIDKSAFCVFTSGTSSGTLKAALLSHTALLHQSRAKLHYVHYSQSDTFLNSAPLHHVGGLSSMLASLMVGSRQVFITQPRFNAKHVLQCCEENNITSMIAVPAMLFDFDAAARDMDTPQTSRRFMCSSLRRLLIGGGGLSTRSLDAAQRVFPNAMIMAAYGMTETASSISFTSAEQWEHQQKGQSMKTNGSNGGNYVGKPADHFDVYIRPLEEDTDVDIMEVENENKKKLNTVGKTGEICIRGPSVMTRYFNDYSSAPLSNNGGWFRSGDVGILHQDGSLSILGRAKDVIRVGSENVHATEVENVILEAKGIEAVAVVGLPDERLGEVVCAMITLQKGWKWMHNKIEKEISVEGEGEDELAWTPYKLQMHCRSMGLSGMKIPKLISLAPNNQLPRTSLGKVKKPVVRDLLIQTTSSLVVRPRL